MTGHAHPANQARHDDLSFGDRLADHLAAAAVISWLRPERGALAVVQTYGVLAAAAVLCTAASVI